MSPKLIQTESSPPIRSFPLLTVSSGGGAHTAGGLLLCSSPRRRPIYSSCVHSSSSPPPLVVHSIICQDIYPVTNTGLVGRCHRLFHLLSCVRFYVCVPHLWLGLLQPGLGCKSTGSFPSGCIFAFFASDILHRKGCGFSFRVRTVG